MRRTIHMLRKSLARVRLYFRAARNWASRCVIPCKNKQPQCHHHCRSQNQIQYQHQCNQEENGEHEDFIEGIGDDTLDDIVNHYFDDTEICTPRAQFTQIFEDDTTVLCSTEMQCENEKEFRCKVFLSVNSVVDSSSTDDRPVRSKTDYSSESGSETETDRKSISLEMSTMFIDFNDSFDFGYLLMADICPFKSSKDLQIVLDLESDALSRGMIM